MPKQRKIPMRMCVGCREMKPKRDLIRVVRNNEGVISLDPIGKAPGRGAYVCQAVDCLKKAQKQHSLERALEHSIEPAVYLQLEEELNKREPQQEA